MNNNKIHTISALTLTDKIYYAQYYCKQYFYTLARMMLQANAKNSLIGINARLFNSIACFKLYRLIT